MKIVEFKKGVYSFVREAGNLKPLTEASLAEQLAVWRAEIPLTDPACYLVLSSEEEQMIDAALGLLARNMGCDRGLGRIDRLDRRLLGWLAESVRWQSEFIPTDGNATVPITEVTAWSLAFRPIA